MSKLRVFYAGYALLIIWAVIKAKPSDAEINAAYQRRLEQLTGVDDAFYFEFNTN